MEIVVVKLRNSYQACLFDSNSLFIKQNSLCVVETEHGIDIGKVIRNLTYQIKLRAEINGKLLRKLTQEDIGQIPEIEAIEKKAFRICKQKADNKNLNMKLVSVKSLFDKTKIIFYFVAENRIDFRELVRELASVFRTRIEMRQIGVRDESRLIGGFGPCGREHCCSHQKDEFDPVSIKMAKEQNLNLNSFRISGMCGRLLCCLAYEYSTYKDHNKNLPRPGTEIKAEDKTYTVISHETLDESCRIVVDDRVIKISKYDLDFINNKYYIRKDLIKEIVRSEDANTDDDNF